MPLGFQDPTGPFLWDGFDSNRVWGIVQEVPSWTVTDAHRAFAATLTTLEGAKTQLNTEAPVILGLILGVCIFRYVVMKAVTAVGWSLIPNPKGDIVKRGKTLTPEKQKRATVTRFENAMWEAIFYTMSASYGCYVYSLQEWTVWPTSNLWVNWPLQPMDDVFRGYYLLGLAFYSQALLSLIFFDKPRSDYWEYMLHHIVTIFLITASYYTRVQRYGLIILMLHDLGDIWLNWAKSFKYLGKRFKSATDLLFVVFVLVFVATRLVFLPLTVIPSGYYEAMQVGPIMGGHIPGFTPMNCALVVLQLLHCFWFYMIIVAVYKQIVTGDLDDIREDEKED